MGVSGLGVGSAVWAGRRVVRGLPLADPVFFSYFFDMARRAVVTAVALAALLAVAAVLGLGLGRKDGDGGGGGGGSGARLGASLGSGRVVALRTDSRTSRSSVALAVTGASQLSLRGSGARCAGAPVANG